MYTWEKKCADFIHTHLNFIIICFVTGLAFIIRYTMLPNVTYDYTMFLKDWFDLLKYAGGLPGLGHAIGNYTPPYMTVLALLTYLPVDSLISIKLVSIVFDYVAAIACARIVYHLAEPKQKEMLSVVAYTAVLFLPVVFVNSAFWGQCDSIYTSFLLLSALNIVKGRHFRAFIFYGVAFAIKLQAIFFLPALLIYYLLSRKFSVKYFLLIPAVWLIASLPGVIAGRPLGDIADIYFGQASEFMTQLSYKYPNVPMLMEGGDVLMLAKVFIIITMTVFLIGFGLLIHKKFRPVPRDYLGLCIWSTFACVLFLPLMHERYAYAGEILAVVYALLRQKGWYYAVAVNLIGFFAYLPFLFGTSPIAPETMAVANLALFLLFSWQSWRSLLRRQDAEGTQMT